MTGMTFGLHMMLAAIELVSPGNDQVVALVPDCQRAMLTNRTLSARMAALKADNKSGKALRHAKEWRMSKPVVFEWRATDGEKGPWEILVSKNPDLTNAQAVLFRDKQPDPATGRDVESDSGGGLFRREESTLNLEIATRYYWRVSSSISSRRFADDIKSGRSNKPPSRESDVGTFVTEDLAPRWIMLEGRTGNFRDLGGRIGMGGRRIRQGMVYRSRGLNDNSFDGIRKGRNRLSVEDVEYLTKTLGIRTDLDLRSGGETAGMNGVSPMGPGVAFVHNSSACYDKCFLAAGKRAMAKNFRVFCDEGNYPILFHCIGGADRTGTLAYVLNGVLGVEKHELETDWESTFYPNIPGGDETEGGNHDWKSEWHFNENFAKYGGPDSTWNERIALYLLDCGVTQSEIDKFRSIMLTEGASRP